MSKETDSTGGSTSYEYDASGNVTKETASVTENGETKTTVTSYTYDSMGNLLTSQCDKETSSYINDKAGRTLLANENGKCTRTLYDELGRVVQEIAPEDYDASKDGLPQADTYADSNVGQRYVYNNKNQLTKEINRLNVTTDYTYYETGEKKSEEFDIYRFEYNQKGSPTKIFVGSENTLAYTYNDDNNLTKEEYANGDVIRYEYDDNGNLTAQYRDDSTSPYVAYVYNAENELTQKVNYDSGLKTVYGENNKVDVYKTSDNTLVQSYFEEEVEREATLTDYDDYDLGENGETLLLPTRNPVKYTKVTENHFGTSCSSVTGGRGVTHTIGSNKVWYGYSYNTEDKAEKMYGDSVEYNGTEALSSTYTYDENGNVTKKKYKFSFMGNAEQMSLINEYDSVGRITGCGFEQIDYEYTYDENGQLKQVIDDYTYNYSKLTTTYKYDSRGNITERKEIDAYHYRPDKTTTYTYDTVKKDQLAKINDNALTYDENGNVLTYAGKTYEWENGRNLKKITDGDNTYSYIYDENGIRTSKTVNGVTTYYNTKDGVILSQTDGTNTMHFQYDINGIPLGFTYNGDQYFYITNQMGDVVGITDQSGDFFAQYRYDEWGRVASTEIVYGTEEKDDKAANANPLRYRGYYYDTETGYYYLQSRYYDPAISRFINADHPAIANISKNQTNGLNAFAYCYNNSVNYKDVSGYDAGSMAATPNVWAILSALIADLGVIPIGLLWPLLLVGTLAIAIVLMFSGDTRKTDKTLPDVKAKEQNKKGHYKFAYVNKKNELVKLGSKKLTFVQVLTALGISNAAYSIKKRYSFNYKESKVSKDVKKAYNNTNGKKWGVYADSQGAAKALSVVLGSNSPPEVHGTGYAHYHTGGKKNHDIHIWFGGPNK